MNKPRKLKDVTWDDILPFGQERHWSDEKMKEMDRKDYLILGALILIATDREMFSDKEIIEMFNGVDNVFKCTKLIDKTGDIPIEEIRALLQEYVDKFLITL